MLEFEDYAFPFGLCFSRPIMLKIMLAYCINAYRQAHDREICFNPVVAILRRTSHCGETARFLPPFFIGGTQHPLIRRSEVPFFDIFASPR